MNYPAASGRGIRIKEPGKDAAAKVHHAELWGDRASKYKNLNLLDITEIEWKIIEPHTPDYLFIQQDSDVKSEYNEHWQVTKIFPVNALGFQTHRDHFAIDLDFEKLKKRIQEFRDTKLNDDEIRSKYELKDNRDWNVKAAREQIRHDGNWEKWFVNCLYRPFDWLPCYFSTEQQTIPER